jgi:hypothetical protein
VIARKETAKEIGERIELMPERQRDAPSLRFCRALEKFFPLCCRIDPRRDAPNLFSFLEVAGMPPTNNHAEQSLRLPVIFRKITFGNQSLRGA